MENEDEQESSPEKPHQGEEKPIEDLGTRIQLRCTAIQQFLFDRATGSEKSIRQAFGDNPDTSKALRMLLKQHRVKRFGSGGKGDPFVYMALVPPHMNELERLHQAKTIGRV